MVDVIWEISTLLALNLNPFFFFFLFAKNAAASLDMLMVVVGGGWCFRAVERFLVDGWQIVVAVFFLFIYD